MQMYYTHNPRCTWFSFTYDSADTQEIIFYPTSCCMWGVLESAFRIASNILRDFNAVVFIFYGQ